MTSTTLEPTAVAIVPDEEAPLLSPATPKDDSAILPTEISFAKLAVTMPAVWLGVFLSAADTTVISTLLAPISNTFSSFTSISWIATGYLIATAALQPLFGRLTDIYGRRPALLLCNVLFGVGTLMCGLATNQYTMIAGRVISGAGGGGLITMSSIIATDLVPLRKRGIVQGVANIAYGTGGALGGVFGGYVHDNFGWRWAFLIQVPFIVVSACVVFAFVKIPGQRMVGAAHHRVDYWGCVTLVGAMVCLLLGLSTGGNTLPWTHPFVVTCLPLSIVLLGVFFAVEKWYAREPVIPVQLLADRTVLAACLTNWFMLMSLYCLYFYGPIYFMLLGQSSTQAGLRLVPFTAGIPIGSLSTGLWVNKSGRYYFLGVLCISTFAAGTLAICTFSLTTPVFPQFFYFFVLGCGYGGTLTVLVLALVSAVGRNQQAVVTSASYAFRSTGSMFGATIGSAVFQNMLVRRLGEYLGDGDEAADIIRKVRERFEEFEGLPERWKGLVALAYMDALHAVFWTSLGLAVAAIFCCTFMRENVLHKTLDRK